MFVKRKSTNQLVPDSKPNLKTSSNSLLLAIIFVMVSLFLVNAVSAATYYTGASGTPETLSNWWTGTNGTGVHPVNFTTAGDIFVIQNTHTMSTAANWTVTGTVQVNSGGIFTSNSSGTSISLGALTINSGGIVNMLRPLTVTGATSITGKINFGSSSSTIRAMAFNGAVTLNSGAVWDETNGGANTVLDTYSFGSSFTNNATTFTNLTGGQHTFTGTTMTLSGLTTTTMDLVAISGTYTNSGTLTVATTLSGAGGLTNGATGILNIGGASTITTLTATAVGNLVNYTGAAQTVKATTYYNLTLSGSGSKTTTGVTVNGILNLAGTATASVAPTYGANATLEYSGSAAQTTGIEFPATFLGTGGVIINNSFGVSLGAAKTISDMLTMTTGTLNMANTNLTIGSLTGSGNITNSSGIATAVTFTIGSDNTSPAAYNGVISNGTATSVAITKNGTGSLTLSGANTYSGLTTISSGTVILGNASALGTTASGTSITNGAVLDLNGTNYSNAETLTINGTGISSGGALINSSVSAANYAGAITLGSASSISTTGNITLGSNGITGAQNLTKIGSGILNLGTGTVTLGSLTISAGTLTSTTSTMNIAGNYTNNSTFTNNSGTVVFNGTTQAIGGSSSSTFNNLTTSNSGTKTLGINTTVSGTLLLTTPTILSISSYTLTLNGTITGTGTGTLSGTSASNIVIGAAAGILNFTSSSDSLNNLTLNSGSSATLGTSLNIFGTVSLTSSTLNFNVQHVTLKSNAIGTASIGNLTGSILIGSTNVTVERYIPNTGRRYRLLTPTVQNAGSIRANWMEGTNNTALSPGGNLDPNPGYGLQVTGAGGSANGFDVTQTNQSSLFLCSNGLSTSLIYTAVPSTIHTADTLNPLTGYFLFVRGDRNENMSLPNTNTLAAGWIPLPSDSTTLRATGSLITGTVTNFTNPIISGFGEMNLITNPYPAPLDWSKVYANCNNVSSTYTLWDAGLSHRGGFTTVRNDGVSTGNGTLYIQPGQAFFVESIGSGTTVSIQESHKVSGNNNIGIYTVQTPPKTFSASLYFTDGTGVRTMADGTTAVYDTSYSAGLDGNDAIKTVNWDENIAINRQGIHLAIDARPVIVSRDTLPLFMSKMNQMSYEWQFTGTNLSDTTIQATLIDNYTGNRTSLSVNGSTVVPFTITSVAASADTGRFMVVFGPLSTLAVNPITVNAYQKNQGIQVDWTAATETNMDHYEVEKSNDGLHFTKTTSLTATGNSSSPLNYNWFDANPFSGNNFYRIKSVDKTGAVKYSNIVKVNIGKGNPAISVYPNPITGNSFGLQLNNIPKGNYEISLTNNLGQQVFSTQLLHNGGSASQNIELKNNLPRGVYQLLFISEGIKMTNSLIKN